MHPLARQPARPEHQQRQGPPGPAVEVHHPVQQFFAQVQQGPVHVSRLAAVASRTARLSRPRSRRRCGAASPACPVGFSIGRRDQPAVVAAPIASRSIIRRPWLRRRLLPSWSQATSDQPMRAGRQATAGSGEPQRIFAEPVRARRFPSGSPVSTKPQIENGGAEQTPADGRPVGLTYRRPTSRQLAPRTRRATATAHRTPAATRPTCPGRAACARRWRGCHDRQRRHARRTRNTPTHGRRSTPRAVAIADQQPEQAPGPSARSAADWPATKRQVRQNRLIRRPS